MLEQGRAPSTPAGTRQGEIRRCRNKAGLSKVRETPEQSEFLVVNCWNKASSIEEMPEQSRAPRREQPEQS